MAEDIENKTGMTKEEQEEYLKSVLNSHNESNPNPPESASPDNVDESEPEDKEINDGISDFNDDENNNPNDLLSKVNDTLDEDEDEDEDEIDNGHSNSNNVPSEVKNILGDDEPIFDEDDDDLDELDEEIDTPEKIMSVPKEYMVEKTNVYPLPDQSELQFFDDDNYPREEHPEDEIIYKPDEDEHYEKEEHYDGDIEEKPKSVLDKILKLPIISDIKTTFYDKPRRFIRTFHSDYYWKNPHSRRGEITRKRMLKSGYVIVRHMWYDERLNAYRINDEMQKGNEVVKLHTKVLSKYNRRRQVHITGQKKRYFLFDSHLTPQEREKERGFTQSAQMDYLLDTSGDEQLAEQVKRQKNDRDWSVIIIVGVIMVSMVLYMMWAR